jgi:hypothetical protein
MNYTERLDLDQYLDELKVPGDLPLDVWSDLVEDAIHMACPADSTIHEHVKKLRTQENDKPQQQDSRIVAYPHYLAGARRILAVRPLDKADETLEHQVLTVLDKKLMDTTIARLIKWAGPIIVTLIFGGTLWAGFEWRGAYDRMVKYLETRTEDVTKEHDQAVRKIRGTLGDEKQKTGALGAILERKENAIKDITEALGSKDQKDSALGQITSSKNAALTSIQTTVGDEQSNTGVIAAIKLKEKNTIELLDGLVKNAPSHMQNLEKRAHDLSVQLEGFESTATKITEAHQILADQIPGIPPDKIGVLLSSSLWTVGVVGFVTGILGSMVMILVTWLVSRTRGGSRVIETSSGK